MEKEFVTYELALKMKQLGFDEPCFAFYDEEEYLFTVREQDDIYEEWLIAPTFSQAFRWFREKYGVHSSPRKYDETQWWAEWGTWTSSIGTFEEAELAWLEKLIEIVETKSE